MTRIEKQPSNAPIGTLANALKPFTLSKSDKALSLRLARPERSVGNVVGNTGRTKGEQYSLLIGSGSTRQRPHQPAASFAAKNSSWNRQFDSPPLRGESVRT
jgi:hypothetical protein